MIPNLDSARLIMRWCLFFLFLSVSVCAKASQEEDYGYYDDKEGGRYEYSPASGAKFGYVKDKDNNNNNYNNNGWNNNNYNNNNNGNSNNANINNGNLNSVNNNQITQNNNATQNNNPNQITGTNINNNNNNNVTDENERYYYEPCRYSNRNECIRHFLSTYGKCKPIQRYRDEVIYREKAVYYLPSFNLTILVTDAQIYGLDGRLDKFYINKKTKNLIYAVNFTSLVVDAKRSYYQLHRRGREPLVVADYTTLRFASTLITAVIPLKKNHLSLGEAIITAYTDGPPTYVIGPKATTYPDPSVQQGLVAAAANPSTVVQEILLTEAPNFFIAYLQNFVCDFGIKV